MSMLVGLLLVSSVGFVQAAVGDSDAESAPAVVQPAVIGGQLEHLRALTARLRRMRPDVFGGEAELGARLDVAGSTDARDGLEFLLARELLLLEQTVARLELVAERGDDVLASAHSLLHHEADYAVEVPAALAVENVGLLIANVGRKPVIEPALALAGAVSWRDMSELARAAVGSAETSEQAALAIWRFLVLNRDHGPPAHEGLELHDPVKLLNVYGYGFCDDAANAFAHLARVAGLEARVWALNGHVVAEAFYDDGWHLFDPDHEVHYRDDDGRILGLEELAARPELLGSAVRLPGRPAYSVDMERLAQVYASTDDNQLARYPEPERFHDMRFTLRDGERVMFWFDDGVRRVATTRFSAPPRVGNGEWIHEFALPNAQLALDYELPWPLLGGRVEFVAAEALEDGSFAVELRGADGAWYALPGGVARDNRWLLNLDAPLAIGGEEPRYALELRVVSRDPTLRANGQVALVFQHAPRALPALLPGHNALHWNARGGAARVTHLYRLH